MSLLLVNIYGDINEGGYEIVDDSGEYIPMSVINTIKADISEFAKIHEPCVKDDVELGKFTAYNVALAIIDDRISDLICSDYIGMAEHESYMTSDEETAELVKDFLTAFNNWTRRDCPNRGD